MKNFFKINRALVAKTKLKLFSLAFMALFATSAWGADFSAADIVKSGGTQNDHVTVSSVFTSTSNQKVCNTSVSTVSISGNANGNGDANYIQIQADEDYTISSLTIDASINQTGSTAAKKIGIVFFSGAYSTTTTSAIQLELANKDATSGCGPFEVDVPSGIRTIRIYRLIKINSSTKVFDGSGTQYGDGTNTYVAGISATAAALCNKPGTPTSLSASDITHKAANLSWTAAANSDGYKVYIEKKSDKSKVLDWTDCATTSYAASGLQAETEYTFKVKAVGADGYCEFGDQATVDFTTEEEPVECPLNLTITGKKAYQEYDNITLTAELEEGTGDITYTWYKGSDLATAKGNPAIGTGVTFSKASCGLGDAGNYWCVATKSECSEASNAVACEVTVAEFTCPTSGTIFSLAMKSGLSDESVNATTDLPLTSNYATISLGSATLRNNDGSNGKAQIKDDHIYFNGGNVYIKVEMLCELAAGDSIEITSTSFENQLWLTNTNSNKTYIETTSKAESTKRGYTVKTDDLLDGYSTFYIWRKSGATYVGTVTITRPDGGATALDNTSDEVKAIKRIENGQLVIEKNGHLYNALGQEIR